MGGAFAASFTAVSGESEIFASTYRLLTLAPSPDSPSPVARVRLTPPTLNVVVLVMVTVRVEVLLICTVLVPVPPDVVQVLTPATTAAPALLFRRLNVTVVPFGAGPKPVAASPPVAPDAS